LIRIAGAEPPIIQRDLKSRNKKVQSLIWVCQERTLGEPSKKGSAKCESWDQKDCVKVENMRVIKSAITVSRGIIMVLDVSVDVDIYGEPSR
jgi:hypothetical protein